MKSKKFIDTLRDLGLTENESKVYFAALSLGPTTILKLSSAAELKRPTVYTVVESLKQKGLMNIEVAGFKKKFVAQDPASLETMLEIRKKKFQELLPDFSALYNLRAGESFIKYYEGLEAVKGVYETLIQDIKPHEDYLILANQDQWFEHDKEYFYDFMERRAKLPISIRMIFQDTDLAHEWKKLERNFNSEIRILSPHTKLTTNLVITPQRVLIHKLTHPVVGIVIDNREVIQMHREMFEVIWYSLGT